MMSGKKIFFADLDGSLLNSEKKITPATKQALDAFMAAGNYFVICTGRAIESAAAVKKDRVRRMEEAAEAAAKACREQILGSTEDVLFETETGGISDGLTGGYFRVYSDTPVKLGEIAPMRLVRLHQDGFWGEMC